MRFSFPEGWENLTQDMLRYILRMMWHDSGKPDWEIRLQTEVVVRFSGIEVVRWTPSGWLCREHKNGKDFVLDPDILPSLIDKVTWVTQTEEISVRIEEAGGYKAVDFELQELPFGRYLEAENLFQSYLLSKSEQCLVGLADVLYPAPEGTEGRKFREEELMGAFLWFNAVKRILGDQFPNFLKPAAEGYQNSVTKEKLTESMRTQIRLLTKGDVTKQQYILDKIDTWTALTELDALAKEAEEIKQKYGK